MQKFATKVHFYLRISKKSSKFARFFVGTRARARCERAR